MNSKGTTVQAWLEHAITQLKTAGLDTARLDALVLLADATGRDKGFLLAHPELELPTGLVNKTQKLLNKRCLHMPLAYLRGHAEFYGREFIVNSEVLVPRPETETMIDCLKELLTKSNGAEITPPNGTVWRIADVGAGSGAIGITVAIELSNTKITLLEISETAIETAKANVVNYDLPIDVLKSDLLQSNHAVQDILLCNLPYVPDEYQINRAASHEPSIALFAGTDGLDLYRRLFAQIQFMDSKPLYILTEALPESHGALSAIAAGNGYSQLKLADFIQVFELI
ncbi:peptide chain release factor N(5)-glutamine methyltransferase [Polaromonas sp.]|nr:peptide chain release factor N(5)-glutamine methyltransferase [Candidatus Saccharibacteria bacterium]